MQPSGDSGYLTLGGTPAAASPQRNLTGRMKHVALYDKVLTPERVLAHYQAGINV